MIPKYVLALFTFFMIFGPFSLSAQDIKINSDGTVTLPEKVFQSTIKVDSSDLDKWNTSEIKRANKAIIKDITDALDFLSKPDNRLEAIYEHIYTKAYIKSLKDDLETIKKSLVEANKTNKYSKANPVNKLKILNTLIVELNGGKKKYYKISTVKKEDKISLKIYKTDAYKDLLLKYYNLVMESSGAEIIKEHSSIKGLDNLVDGAENIRQGGEALRSLDMDIVTIEQLDEAYKILNALFNNPPPATKLEEYIKSKWFTLWFWKTGGQLQTTPLEFTEPDLLRLPDAKIDEENYAKYQTFLNKASEKFLEDSSARDAAVYKKEVLDKYNQRDLFVTNTDKIDKIKNTNSNLKITALSTNRFLNKIEVKGSNKKRNTYSYNSASQQSGPIAVSKFPPITIDEYVGVVVYNIKKGDSAKIDLKKDEIIKDESEVTSSLSNNLGILSTTLANPILAPVTGWLESLNLEERFGVTLINNKQNKNAQHEVVDPNSLESVLGIIHADTNNHNKNTAPPKEYIKKELIRLHKSILLSISFARINGISNTEFDSDFYTTLWKNEIRKLPVDIALIEAKKRYVEHLTNKLLKPKVKTWVKQEENQDVLNRISTVDVISEFLSNSSAPMQKVKALPASEPEMYSMQLYTDMDEEPKYRKYDVIINPKGGDKKKTAKLATFSYKTGKRHRIQASIGLSYTFEPVVQTKASMENNKVKVENTAEQYGVVAALHFYPFNKGVFLQDPSFFGRDCYNVCSRINFMAGVDFRNAPRNVYLGVGYDFGPGIKLNAGVHLYSYNKYDIKNDIILSEQKVYRVAIPYIYLGISPSAFVSAINLFK